MAKSRGVVPDEDGFRRIRRSVLRSEGTPFGGGTHRKKTPVSKGFKLLRGTLDSALSNTGTATVSVTTWDGSAWSDSGRDIASVRTLIPITSDISAGKVVVIVKMHGDWFVLDAECE